MRAKRGWSVGVARCAAAVAIPIATTLLVILVAGVAPGVASNQHSTGSTSTPVVYPFFEVAVWKRGDRRKLMALRVFGVTPGERVIHGCSGCQRARFRSVRGSDRVTLQVAHPLRMTSRTRILVGVVSPGSTGRWLVIGFRTHQYRGVEHGCMPARVTSLSAAWAADPSHIPSASCAAPCPSPPGTEYVQWRGTDQQLWELQYNGKQWGASVPVGSGTMSSPPAAVVRLGGQRDVFWKGPDRRLWEMWYSGFWNGPAHLKSAGRLGSAPGAFVDARNIEHVFWKGTNGWLWELSDPGGVWSAAVPLDSGPIGSAPAIVSNSDGGEDVFWKGTHGGLWEMRFTGTWHSARKLVGAGKIASAPTAVSDADGTDHVFWRGNNGWLWELSDPGGHWGASVPRNSGSLGSAPVSVLHPDGQLDVFWNGTDGRLRELTWTTAGWHGPVRIDQATHLDSSPTAALGRCS